jgi:hypothetical protein
LYLPLDRWLDYHQLDIWAELVFQIQFCTALFEGAEIKIFTLLAFKKPLLLETVHVNLNATIGCGGSIRRIYM